MVILIVVMKRVFFESLEEVLNMKYQVADPLSKISSNLSNITRFTSIRKDRS